jgi:hypothetical protein
MKKQRVGLQGHLTQRGAMFRKLCLCLCLLLLSSSAAMAQMSKLKPVSGLSLVEGYPQTLRGGIAMDGWSAQGEASGEFLLHIPKGAKIRQAFLASTLKAPIHSEGEEMAAFISEEAHVSVGLDPSHHWQFSEMEGRFPEGWDGEFPISYWVELREVVEPLAYAQMQADTYEGLVRIPVREQVSSETSCAGFVVIGHNLIVVWEHEAALPHRLTLKEGVLMAQNDGTASVAMRASSAAMRASDNLFFSKMCMEKPELRLPHVLSVSVVSMRSSDRETSVDENLWGPSLGIDEMDATFLVARSTSQCTSMVTGSFGGAWRPPGPPACGWPEGANQDRLSTEKMQADNGSGLFNLSAADFPWPGAELSLRLSPPQEGTAALTLAVEQRPVSLAKGDADGDGLLDEDDDACLDSDGDGRPNRFDVDSDGDCIPDGADPEPTVHNPHACGPGRQCHVRYDKLMGECVEVESLQPAKINVGALSGGGSACGGPGKSNMAFLLGGSGLLWAWRRSRRRK